MPDKVEVDELREQEAAAKQAIQSFIEADLNGRVSYLQEKRRLEAGDIKQDHDNAAAVYKSFWDDCEASFKSYLDMIDPSKYRLDDTKESSFVNPLDDLKEQYQSIKDQYYMSGLAKKWKECDKIFSTLVVRLKEIEDASSESLKFKSKDFHLDFLCKAVDLRDENVLELLPYLLTAYTYNSQRTHLFYNHPTKKGDESTPRRLNYIFENVSVDSFEASRIRKLVRDVAALFVFETPVFKDFDKQDESGRYKPLYSLVDPQMKGSSYLTYGRVLDDFFREWCEIIDRHRGKLKTGSRASVDYQKSLDLYNNRAGRSVESYRR